MDDGNGVRGLFHMQSAHCHTTYSTLHTFIYVYIMDNKRVSALMAQCMHVALQQLIGSSICTTLMTLYVSSYSKYVGVCIHFFRDCVQNR